MINILTLLKPLNTMEKESPSIPGTCNIVAVLYMLRNRVSLHKLKLPEVPCLEEYSYNAYKIYVLFSFTRPG